MEEDKKIRIDGSPFSGLDAEIKTNNWWLASLAERKPVCAIFIVATVVVGGLATRDISEKHFVVAAGIVGFLALVAMVLSSSKR